MLAFKWLIVSIRPGIIFFQEYMVESGREKDLFLKCYPNWDCYATNSNGLSGGLISGWNRAKANLQDFGTHTSILLEGRVKDVNSLVKLINFYGQYSDWVAF
jgi:hypothetical protein